jgi:putative transposase
MSTYTQILYHVVFSTKDRERVLAKGGRDDLYRFIWGTLKERESHLYRIGGVEDHVHMLISLHPSIALSDLVKEVKTASSKWIKGTNTFPDFTHWQPGYGAFTHSLADKDEVVAYIKNQEEHHKVVSFREEYEALLKKAGLVLNPAYEF